MPVGYLVSLGGNNALDSGDVISGGTVTFTTQTTLGAGQWTWSGTFGGTTYTNEVEPGVYYVATNGNVYFVPDFGPVDTLTSSSVISAPAYTSPVIFGTSGNEILIGTSAANTIYGGATTSPTGTGNDTINAGAGNDTIYGGDGNDSITGGAGADSIVGGTGTDTASYSGSTAGVSVNLVSGTGTSGDAQGDVLTGIENIAGSAFNDTLTGDSAANVISGGAGNDQIAGGDGNDTLDGGAGTDVITGGAGADSLLGGDGNDTIYGGAAPVAATQEHLSWIAQGASGTNLAGGFTQDTGGMNVTASFVNDGGNTAVRTTNATEYVAGGEPYSATSGLYLAGNAGPNVTTTLTFNPESGSGLTNQVSGVSFRLNDIDMAGWQDIITITAFDANGNPVAVNITISGNDFVSGNTITAANTSDAQSSILGSALISIPGPVHSVQITYSNGGTSGQALYVTDVYYTTIPDTDLSTDGTDTIDGGTGADVILAQNGDDQINLTGTFGNDTITGGETGETAGDVINSTTITANETLTFSGNEAGTLSDGTSTATFSEIERFVLGTGNDTVNASATTVGVNVDAGGGNDSMLGGSGADTLIGGIGNDTIQGGAGADSLSGGTGTDTLSYANSGAAVNVDLSTNTASGGHATGDTISGFENVTGSAFNDTLTGDAGANVVLGGGGDDTINLTDGFGNDTIVGGETGETNGDTLDTSGLTTGVNVTFTSTGGETGTVVVGGDTASFSEIENVIYTAQNDFIDASVTTVGLDIDAGAGDDTILGGTGDDTLTGGTGADTFVYNAGDGADIITDFDTTTGISGDPNDAGADQSDNDFIDLSAFYDDAAVAAYNAANGGLDDIGHELNLMRADAADGTLDGIINGVNIQSEISGLNLTLQSGGTAVDPATLNFENTNVVCFTSGTAIRTPSGDRLIEDLVVGDLVTTMDNGPQRIRWIGSRTLDHATLLANPKVRPIFIRQGALGTERNLLVSPQHGMLIGRNGDHLVRAKHLVEEMPGVRVANGRKEVTYVHLMFDAHQIVFAENAASESFYPGPMAIESLMDAPRAELYDLFPELRGMTPKLSKALDFYGPTARRFGKRQDLPELLQIGSAAFAPNRQRMASAHLESV